MNIKDLTIEDFIFVIAWPLIEHVLGKRETKQFCKFMDGQTCGYIPGTEIPAVYIDDLIRFLKYRRQGMKGKYPLDD